MEPNSEPRTELKPTHIASAPNLPEIEARADWLRELLGADETERTLLNVKARLLILDGQILLHYRTQAEPTAAQQSARYVPPPLTHYKFVSPQSVWQAFNRVGVDSGWLPPGIVRCGVTVGGLPWAVKFVPPARHTLNLYLPDAPPPPPPPEAGLLTPETPQLGKLQIIAGVPLPGMVLMGVGSQYRIWAVGKSNSQFKTGQFDPEAFIHAAPLPNVYDDGQICWGNGRPPVADGQGVGRAWAMFIGSDFTNHLVENKSRQHPKDIRFLLAELAVSTALTKNKGKTPYPMNDLNPYLNEKGVGSNKQGITAREAIEFYSRDERVS
jgi:hypothetical protein